MTDSTFSWMNQLIPESEISISGIQTEYFQAILTDSNQIHIFSHSNIPLTILTYPEPIKEFRGNHNFLFVYYGFIPHFELLDIQRNKCLKKGFLPTQNLLHWIHLKKNSIVLIQNNSFKILGLSNDFGNQWVPLFNPKPLFTETQNSFRISEYKKWKIRGSFSTDEGDYFSLSPISLNSEHSQLLFSFFLNDDSDIIERDIFRAYGKAVESNKLLLAFQLARFFKTKESKQLAIQFSDQNGKMVLSTRLNELFKNVTSKLSPKITDIELDEELFKNFVGVLKTGKILSAAFLFSQFKTPQGLQIAMKYALENGYQKVLKKMVELRNGKQESEDEDLNVQENIVESLAEEVDLSEVFPCLKPELKQIFLNPQPEDDDIFFPQITAADKSSPKVVPSKDPKEKKSKESRLSIEKEKKTEKKSQSHPQKEKAVQKTPRKKSKMPDAKDFKHLDNFFQKK